MKIVKIAMKTREGVVTDISAWGFVTRKQAEKKLAQLRGHRPVDKWFARQIADENRLYEQLAQVLERYIERMWPSEPPRQRSTLWWAEYIGERVWNGFHGYWAPFYG